MTTGPLSFFISTYYQHPQPSDKHKNICTPKQQNIIHGVYLPGFKWVLYSGNYLFLWLWLPAFACCCEVPPRVEWERSADSLLLPFCFGLSALLPFWSAFPCLRGSVGKSLAGSLRWWALSLVGSGVNGSVGGCDLSWLIAARPWDAPRLRHGHDLIRHLIGFLLVGIMCRSHC